MKQLIIFLVAILLFGLLSVATDIRNAQEVTFFVENKYSQWECVNFLCIRREMVYYVVSSEAKTYHTWTESDFDKMVIGEQVTAKVTPREGYIYFPSAEEETKSVTVTLGEIIVTAKTIAPWVFYVVVFAPPLLWAVFRILANRF